MPDELLGLADGVIVGLLTFGAVAHYAPWWIALNAGLVVCRFLWALIEGPDA